MDAAKSITVSSPILNGDWRNVDPQTAGLVRIIVNGNMVHPYGACKPVACDIGDIKAQVFASGVQNKDEFSILGRVIKLDICKRSLVG
jgi:hypothetical protein